MTKILISLLFCTLLSTAQSRYTLTLSKKKVYVGEPIAVTLTLENNGSNAPSKIRFAPFKAKDYKIALFTGETKKQHQKEYQKQYLVTPYLPGIHTLPPQSIEVAHKDPQTYRNIWETLQTPPVTLTVLPLPAGIDTVGNYILKSSIDHHSLQQNTPLNFTVTIEGTGLLDTVKALQLQLKDAVVFGGEPHISTTIDKGTYRSTLTQTFAIIAEKDFTLPSLTWRYLNTDTGLIETLATPSYQIRVAQATQKKQILLYTGLILFGLLLGSLLTLILLKLRRDAKHPATDLSKKIRKARSDTALYHLLLPHADNHAIANILKKLEENMAQKSRHHIDRSAIEKLIKQSGSLSDS